MVTYLNAVHAGFLIVDDIQLSNALESLHKATLTDFFRPGGDRYFRPLSMISCFADYLIFGRNPAGFHLVNLLIHLSNAQLVYFLAVRFMPDDTKKERYALIAALVFALHPINTEAVIWVSARPDLLSCFFFLIAMILMICPVSSALLLPAFVLFLSILCAFLSKESSLSLLALAPVYCFLERKRRSAGNIAMIILPLLIAAVVYFYLRTGPTLSADKGLIKVITSSKPVTVMFFDTIAAYGFYVGKLFYPFPLSFTIPTIDRTLNTLLFLLFLPAATVAMIRQKSFRLPLLIVLTGLIPPILALIGNLPVVPYAERYLYLSTTGFSLFTAIFVSRYLNKVPDLLVISVVLLAAIPTVLRVNLWSEPVTFWHDTVSKSPGASVPHLALAVELINAGNYGEAKRELKKADGIGYDRENIRGFAVQVSATLDRITARGTPTAAP